MPKRAPRATDSIALPTSPIRAPGTAAAMPAASAASAVSIRVWSRGLRGSPTTMENAASAHHPSTCTARSTDRMSPWASGTPLGMPCTMASLTLMQVTAGYGVGANCGW